ncbi:hypothetical protein KSP39_PZI022438 [Platanthera zijinensis]|uniref:Uncharacterized protein n=1 Tax=Platanthera zijinensis TaxID=2320716 RepID=A0AAP0FUZ3_9ASPA
MTGELWRNIRGVRRQRRKEAPARRWAKGVTEWRPPRAARYYQTAGEKLRAERQRFGCGSLGLETNRNEFCVGRNGIWEQSLMATWIAIITAGMALLSLLMPPGLDPAVSAPVSTDPVNCFDKNPKLKCCPRRSSTEIVNFKPELRASPPRIRRPAHALRPEAARKYEKAIALMRALPEDHPWNFIQQSNVHCAYCSGGYVQLGLNITLDVRFTLLFLCRFLVLGSVSVFAKISRGSPDEPDCCDPLRGGTRSILSGLPWGLAATLLIVGRPDHSEWRTSHLCGWYSEGCIPEMDVAPHSLEGLVVGYCGDAHSGVVLLVL